MYNKNIRKNKGITLIALVITIIILIILAGIVISLSLGENGLFDKAKHARDKYIKAANEEQEELAKVGNYIEKAREDDDSDTSSDVVDYNYSKFTMLYGGLGFINYETDTNIVDDYVVQEDGLLSINIIVCNTNEVRITNLFVYINGYGVSWLQSYYTQMSKNVNFPVKKGDVIKIVAQGGATIYTNDDLCKIAIYPTE